MESLLIAILSNAALVAVLAPLILLIDRLARRPALSHALWALMLLKLVTPPLIALPFPQVGERPAAGALPEQQPKPPADDQSEPEDPTPPVEEPEAETQPASSPQSEEAAGAESVATVPSVAETSAPLASPSPLAWLAWGWLGVSLLGLLRLGTAVIRAGRELSASPDADEPLSSRVADLARRLSVRRPPSAHLVSGVMSPVLWGLGPRARLLIPRDLWERLDDTQRDALIVHELAHYRRGDHWVRLLEIAALSLYSWFPVAWWARRALREAEEQCCDAWVVWALPEARRAYAAALLDTLDFLAAGRPAAAPLLASGFGSVAAVKQRLALIVRGQTSRALPWGAGACLGALALVVLPMAPPGRAQRRDWVIESLQLGDRIGQVYERAHDPRRRFRRTLPLPIAAYDAAFAPDGALIVAGHVDRHRLPPAGIRPRFGEMAVPFGGVGVSRLIPDGTPDHRFGQGGMAVLDDLVLSSQLRQPRELSVTVQPDGKIVVATTGCWGCRANWPGDFALARLLADGTLDRNFGDGGYVATNIGWTPRRPHSDNRDDRLAGVVLQPDGKIVAAGTTSGRFAAVRYTPEGRLDPTFGREGRMCVEETPPASVGTPIDEGDHGTARTVVAGPNGRTLIVGWTRLADAAPWAVTALDARGQPDPSFGDRGVVWLDLARKAGPPGRWGIGLPGPTRAGFAGQPWSHIEGAVVQPDGKLVIAGTVYGTGQPDTDHLMRPDTRLLVRLDTHGRLDPTFGDGGLLRPSSLQEAIITDLAAGPGGRLFLCGSIGSLGSSWPGRGCDLFLAALDADGQVAPEFGARGTLRVELTGWPECPSRLLVQPDGQLVTAGCAPIEGHGTMLFVARFRDRARPHELLGLAGLGTLLTGLGLVATRRGDARKEVRSKIR